MSSNSCKRAEPPGRHRSEEHRHDGDGHRLKCYDQCCDESFKAFSPAPYV